MSSTIIKHWPAAEGMPAFTVRKVDESNIEVVCGNYRECPTVQSGNVVYARPELFPRAVKAVVYKAMREAGHVV